MVSESVKRGIAFHSLYKRTNTEKTNIHYLHNFYLLPPQKIILRIHLWQIYLNTKRNVIQSTLLIFHCSRLVIVNQISFYNYRLLFEHCKYYYIVVRVSSSALGWCGRGTYPPAIYKHGVEQMHARSQVITDTGSLCMKAYDDCLTMRSGGC